MWTYTHKNLEAPTRLNKFLLVINRVQGVDLIPVVIAQGLEAHQIWEAFLSLYPAHQALVPNW